MSSKIAIDVRMAARAHYSGIAEYIHNVVPRCLERDDSREYVLIGSPEDIADLQGDGQGQARAVIDTSPIYSLREQIILRQKVSRTGCDLLFCPHYSLPIAAPCPKVVTIHDLIHLKHPSSALAKWYARVFLPLVTKEAARIIADSESTKRDLIETISVPESKIVVCHLGVDARYAPVHDCDALTRLRETLHLPERFALYVGAMRKHKNIEDAFRALARLRKDGASDLFLVLTGDEESAPESLKTTIGECGLADRVVFCGFVALELMPCLYSAARMLVFVSRYEGFGLPPLEAMACGTPVVASNASSIPEVVGDSALMVDPDDTDAIADAMRRLDCDESLRRELSAKGINRAARFTWDKTTEKVLRVFREVLGE